MTNVLNTLIVEDSEDDCHLLLRELRRGGYLVRFEREATAEQMVKALAHDKFDIVFADYVLHEFDAQRALALLKQANLNLPFIIIGETVAEDVSVTALKIGANDYVLKNNLKRLLPIVEIALREVQEQSARSQTVNDDVSRGSESQYRILFDSNPHPMWVYELKTLRFLAVNDAAIRHYGYSRDEFMAMTVKGLRNPDSIPALLKQTIREGEGFSSSGLWKHRKKDGSPIDVEITSNGIVFDGKRAQLVLALDVTEKLKARHELQEKADELAAMTQQLWHASKLATMGELAANIAHELNNPLATISLRVETLANQLSGDEQKHKSLKVVMGEVERMATLVNNLLQFTRRNQRQVSTINIADEVTRSIELISYYLRNRKIEVVKEFDESPPAIHADRQQLRQVFLNLMTNAGDAMPEGGTLTVRVCAEPETGRIAIEFSDTGQGIAETEMEKIWEPFYTSKPEGKGTGLGLSICNRIIEEHGGMIALQSELGKGTTVRVVLPVANAGSLETSDVSSSTSVSGEKTLEAGTSRARGSLTTLMTFHQRQS